MTFREAFVAGVRDLRGSANPTESPELDARVLLGFVTNLSHASLLARWPDELSAPHLDQFLRTIERRRAGEPVAWITGTKEFLGRDFQVGPGLLVPRADTETLVEAALKLKTGPRVVDLCTGTGCVAVSLAAEFQEPREVWATDLSALAVEMATRNSETLLPPERRLRVVQADLMQGLPGTWDLIVSNPPYLTPDETTVRVGPGGWLEPALALDGGGVDGLDLIRRLLEQATGVLNPGGWLLLEASGPQMPAIGQLLVESGLGSVRCWKDLAGIERVIGGQLGPKLAG